MEAEISFPWPWETAFFDGSDVPGATGWTCDQHRGTRDRATLADGGDWGDGDGFPDALDCDNEDPETASSLPELDGFASSDCASSDGDCYTCPEGSTQPADDDDSGTDDDDSGANVDDDDDFTTWAVEEGCAVSGCGVSWSASAGLVLPLLGLRRRRWPSARPGGR